MSIRPDLKYHATLLNLLLLLDGLLGCFLVLNLSAGVGIRFGMAPVNESLYDGLLNFVLVFLAVLYGYCLWVYGARFYGWHFRHVMSWLIGGGMILLVCAVIKQLVPTYTEYLPFSVFYTLLFLTPFICNIVLSAVRKRVSAIIVSGSGVYWQLVKRAGLCTGGLILFLALMNSVTGLEQFRYSAAIEDVVRMTGDLVAQLQDSQTDGKVYFSNVDQLKEDISGVPGKEYTLVKSFSIFGDKDHSKRYTRSSRMLVGNLATLFGSLKLPHQYSQSRLLSNLGKMTFSDYKGFHKPLQKFAGDWLNCRITSWDSMKEGNGVSAVRVAKKCIGRYIGWLAFMMTSDAVLEKIYVQFRQWQRVLKSLGAGLSISTGSRLKAGQFFRMRFLSSVLNGFDSYLGRQWGTGDDAELAEILDRVRVWSGSEHLITGFRSRLSVSNACTKAPGTEVTAFNCDFWTYQDAAPAFLVRITPVVGMRQLLLAFAAPLAAKKNQVSKEIGSTLCGWLDDYSTEWTYRSGRGSTLCSISYDNEQIRLTLKEPQNGKELQYYLWHDG